MRLRGPVPPLVPGVRERGSALRPGPVRVLRPVPVPSPGRQPGALVRGLVRRQVRVRRREPGWLPVPVLSRARVWVRLRVPVPGEQGPALLRARVPVLRRVQELGAQVRGLVQARVWVRLRVLGPGLGLPPEQQPPAPVLPPVLGQLPVSLRVPGQLPAWPPVPALPR
ncbi:hypothetical protein OZK63_19915, partial [Streptomyces sp. UMAF16]|nr:hypothetical protein [Streptomyces sp. UMAF16]